jgi:hypothetical protein
MTMGLEPIDSSHEKQNAEWKNHEGIADESQVAVLLLVETQIAEEDVVLALQARLEIQHLHFDSHEEVADHHSGLRNHLIHLISAFPPPTGTPRP